MNRPAVLKVMRSAHLLDGTVAELLPCLINIGYAASRRSWLPLDGPGMSCGVPAGFLSSFRTQKRPDMQKTTCGYFLPVLLDVSFNNVLYGVSLVINVPSSDSVMKLSHN